MSKSQLGDLVQGPPHSLTIRPQRYLDLAHESANEALQAMHSLREQRFKAMKATRGGRTSDQDQDLLRAMLVFASAGADAAMKSLIRDALPVLADMNEAVQRKLDDFAESHLSDAGSVSPKTLARVLGHAVSPRQAIVEEFILDLTGGSLQSSEQLGLVCGALGIEDPELRKRVRDLSDVFHARNEIIHEMDLAGEEERSTRRQRKIESMVAMADDALQVAQDIVNAIGIAVSSSRPTR